MISFRQLIVSIWTSVDGVIFACCPTHPWLITIDIDWLKRLLVFFDGRSSAALILLEKTKHLTQLIDFVTYLRANNVRHSIMINSNLPGETTV